MTTIAELLLQTKRNGASDLHLSPNSPPLIRVHGKVLPLNMPPLSPEAIKSMLYEIMKEAQRSTYENDYELDFAIQISDELRFRVNAYNTIDGAAAAFRIIPTEILSLDALKMPHIIKQIAQLKKGLILVTGPTGSGKSTTLAAIVDHINSTSEKHILTVEDPVEFVHKSKKSLVNQRELESSTHSFARALKSALRQDPDVILVGELRDIETIELALTAAETGHLVMGTLHTSSAAKTVDRIIDAFPAGEKPLIMSMLSTSLEAVIAQTLLPTSDGQGRVAALEILLGTPAVRNLIREGKLPQITSLMQVGSKQGMRTMKDSVYTLMEQGIIDQKTAKLALNEKSEEEFETASNANDDGDEEQKIPLHSSAPQAFSTAENDKQSPLRPAESSGFHNNNEF